MSCSLEKAFQCAVEELVVAGIQVICGDFFLVFVTDKKRDIDIVAPSIRGTMCQCPQKCLHPDADPFASLVLEHWARTLGIGILPEDSMRQYEK